MNSARAITLFLWVLNCMAQTLPQPAGPYFEPLPDWQYKAGIVQRGIVIAPGDAIIPQIGNSGTPQDGGFYMIFQASNVSTTMATFQVEFFDSKGQSMNMPLPTSPDDLSGTPARGHDWRRAGPCSRRRLQRRCRNSRARTRGRALFDESQELISGAPPREFSLPSVSNPTFFSGRFGFRVEVPEGATKLSVRLRTQTVGANVKLYVNRGSDPVLSDGRIISDYSSTNASGDESIVVTPQSSPSLQGGTHFIAFALFTTGVEVTATIDAVVEVPRPSIPRPAGPYFEPLLDRNSL